MYRTKSDGTYAFTTRFWVAAAILGIFIVWIGWNTQQARNETERIARETSEYAKATNKCLGDLLLILDERSRIAAENDRESQIQREQFGRVAFELNVWLNALVNPPADIAKLDPNHPDRQAWGLQLTERYNRTNADALKVITESQKEQVRLDRERESHQLTNPECTNLRPPEQ